MIETPPHWQADIDNCDKPISPWMANELAAAVPSPAVGDATDWMEKNVKLVGSARKEEMDFSATPWTREVARAATSGRCRIVTFVKPVQSGGSAIGEACLCYWLSTEAGGDFQYNWEDDQKALKRWDERVEPIFLKCAPLMARAPVMDKSIGKWSKCYVRFPHCNFTMQGTFTSKRLDSSTIRFQVNEELHNWEEGRYAKAEKRTTAVWNAVILNISNAGLINGELHRVFESGTRRHWQVKCPSCGQFHILKTQWDSRKPELGGLRYDADGCRFKDGHYDYNKLAPTVRYQMPCGAMIQDDPVIRRQMSLSGKYSEPKNTGATPDNESFTLEAVSVDYIRWIDLIKEKHAALLAMKFGKPEAYWTYLQERESKFIDPMEDRPVVGRITVTSGTRKREGIKNRIARLGALDYQHGDASKGELPHWWGVIRDFDENLDSMLVFEGKLETEQNAAAVMIEHQVLPTRVVVDSGYGTDIVYPFCLRNGFNAIKGGTGATFAHREPKPHGSHRIYSEEEPLWPYANLNGPIMDDPKKEPLFWQYSKSGIREKLHWIRACTKWGVPSDVSEDYRMHMESEELQTSRRGRSNEEVKEWVQIRNRNDLFVCECYIAMMIDMLGLIEEKILK